MNLTASIVVLLSAWAVAEIASAQPAQPEAEPTCGKQAGGALCPDLRCCSQWGYCGDTSEYCGETCQLSCWSDERADGRCGFIFGNTPCGESRCCSIADFCGSGPDYCRGRNCQYRCPSRNNSLPLPSNSTAASVSDIISESVFNEMFPFQTDCPSQGFYTFNAFLVAADSFPGFATTGDLATRKREVAAFLAHVSQATAEKGSELEAPYKWGLCHINTTAYDTGFCTSSNWPCAAGKKYSPRGAIQLSHNFNYGVAGQALGLDLISEPELVATDPVVSFKTAIWFWMTQHDNKPSCHDIVLNANSGAVRIPRSGIIGNIIARALGHRISGGSSSLGFYNRFCDIMGVSYGHDLKVWLDNVNVPSSFIEMPVA